MRKSVLLGLSALFLVLVGILSVLYIQPEFVTHTKKSYGKALMAERLEWYIVGLGEGEASGREKGFQEGLREGISMGMDIANDDRYERAQQFNEEFGDFLVIVDIQTDGLDDGDNYYTLVVNVFSVNSYPTEDERTMVLDALNDVILDVYNGEHDVLVVLCGYSLQAGEYVTSLAWLCVDIDSDSYTHFKTCGWRNLPPIDVPYDYRRYEYLMDEEIQPK